MKYVSPEPMSGCWLWIGPIQNAGYGRTAIDGKSKSAHRLSWEIFRGPIPKGLCVCHACDVPICVNPSHLWLGTHLENIQDASRKGKMGLGGYFRKKKG
jgi:hypothetical protein